MSLCIGNKKRKGKQMETIHKGRKITPLPERKSMGSNVGATYKSSMTYEVYTDCSVINSGQTRKSEAGIAFYILDGAGKKVAQRLSKIEGEITVARGELIAILEALKFIEKSETIHKVKFFSDSKTVVEGILGITRRNSNLDIWEEIIGVIARNKGLIEDFVYVARENNEEADSLSKIASRGLIIPSSYQIG